MQSFVQAVARHSMSSPEAVSYHSVRTYGVTTQFRDVGVPAIPKPTAR